MGASGTEPLYVDDVFSTYLYYGDVTDPITNGIDLSGEGGLVWIKIRNESYSHVLTDTERGAGQVLVTNSSSGSSGTYGITSFNSDGFSLDSTVTFNTSKNYVSWTFRKAPGFFDVVTYTGTWDGVTTPHSQTISHNLGSVPAVIIIKQTNQTRNWIVYHTSTGAGQYLSLSTTAAAAADTDFIDNTAPTSTTFDVGASYSTNQSGGSYVAYLFAHDAGGFGTNGDESIIKCGSYTGNGVAGGQQIDLGFEPQWLIIKAADSQTVNDWQMYDNMRGIHGYTSPTFNSETLLANTNDVEDQRYQIGVTPTGFNAIDSHNNTTNIEYIYIAIRRPHKPPEAGTDVFKSFAWSGNSTSQDLTVSSAPDFMHVQGLNIATTPHFIDILRGKPKHLVTSATDAESTTSTLGILEFYENSAVKIGSNSTFNLSGYTYAGFSLKRAPGFFDMVTYTGTGSATTVNHNLGVAPELMIIKRRDDVANWPVYHQALGASAYLWLNTTGGEGSNSGNFNATTPTASSFSVGGANNTNASSGTYIAYLFASLTGISKVGSYSGTGNDINVDCGFTAGARFVLIKRSDTGGTGDWYWWDSVRGINAGNDPYARFNVNDTEVTNTDYIDPINSGFTVTSSAPAELNTNGGTYIFLAIA